MIEIKTSSDLLDEFLRLRRVPQKEDFLPILELPRQQLIADLEKVLGDIITSITTGDDEEIYHEDQQYQRITALSCIFLLTELKSIESMPLFFRLFSLENDVLDYYFSDHIYETLWSVLLAVGVNDIDAIFSFLKKTDVTSIGAGIVLESLVQMALHFPNLNQKIKKYFIDLYTYLYENDKDFRISIDDTNLTFIEKLDFTEFESVLKMFYDSDRIGNNEDIKIPFEMILEDLKEFQEPFSGDKYEILSLEKIYNHSATQDVFWQFGSAEYVMDSSNTKSDKNTSERVFFSDYSPYLKATPTVGRNEPCPCGSGKKYKKCCEK